jgi:hypothetical protein
VSAPADIDGILVQWGERLFYPPNRIVRPTAPARLSPGLGRRAAGVRARIRSTIRRAPQVMVKVTGGGRGARAIAAHIRYISKDGRLPLEDDRGAIREGMEVVQDVVEQWRYAGSYIPDTGPRREAFNITLSMPHGTDPLAVQRAGREFAEQELKDHRWVMVLHDHQANPHVHISVRAESQSGRRLSPRKTDLHRWRETFAERLRGWGIEAEATRQATRGVLRNSVPTWRVKAREEDRLNRDFARDTADKKTADGHTYAIEAWAEIIQGLLHSGVPGDRELAREVSRYVRSTPLALKALERQQQRAERERELELTRAREGDRVQLKSSVTRTRPDRDLQRAPEVTRTRPDRDLQRAPEVTRTRPDRDIER